VIDVKEHSTTRSAMMEATPSDNETVLNLLLRRVRLRAGIRIAWLRHIWETALHNNETTGTSEHEINGYLNNIDDPVKEAAWIANAPNQQAALEEIAYIEKCLSLDSVSRLYQLATIFQLEEEETDLLQSCLSLTLDPNLGRIYAYLQDHNGRPFVTAALVSRLFNHQTISPLYTSSALLNWEIIRQVETGRGDQPRLELDPFIRNWLLGATETDNGLEGVARLQPAYQPLPHWPVKETAAAIAQIIQTEQHPMIRVLVTGPEGSGKKTFAEAVSRQLGVQLLTINSDRIPEQQWPPVYLHAQRQAYLDRYAILWSGHAALERNWPQQVASFNLQFITAEQGAVVLPDEAFIDYNVQLPPIPAATCIQLWQQFIPAAAQWPQPELEQMVSRQKATIGQITLAARKGVTTLAAASDCIKGSARQRLGKLAQQLSSDFTWNDLIIPGPLHNSLEDLAFEATERNAVWEMPETKRLFPQGRGLVALFTGPPGTGKTMAAQVIANSLQLDLFRIDLAAITSKYVGETSKNIDRILSTARDMNIVLLFDEADSLFGKRTEIKDAHDRFANTDTNYLLQAIEDYPGIVLLASNRKANIDAGFLRRLRYVLDFPKPDVQQRYELWKRLLTGLASPQLTATLDKELHQLAGMLEITGAQVKQTVLSALFMARKEKSNITIHHLLNGLERELAKEGRDLGRRTMDNFKKQDHG
jgi:AAA+ superfamily predicted ATPase